MPSIAPTPAVALLPKVVERLHLRDDRGQALDGMNHLGDGNPSIGLIVHPGHVGSAIPQSRGADLGRVLVVQMGRLEKVQFVGHGETRRHLYPHRISPRIGASQRRVQAGYVLLRETTNNPLTKKCTFIQGTSTPFNPLPFLPPVGEPAATAHSRICDTPSLSTVDSHRRGPFPAPRAAAHPSPPRHPWVAAHSFTAVTSSPWRNWPGACALGPFLLASACACRWPGGQCRPRIHRLHCPLTPLPRGRHSEADGVIS